MIGIAANGDGVTGASAKLPAEPYSKYVLLVALAWNITVAGSLVFNLEHHREQARLLTAQTARALLEKDVLYREWSILHGEVYVPLSNQPGEGSRSEDVERVIRTPSGQELTLLNPAIVSRQIFELEAAQTGVRGHLASLNPISMLNLPDAWERQALESFSRGEAWASAVEEREGEEYFRLMHPLVIVPACLRCHEERGHKVGDLRGGISVTVPMNRFKTHGENERIFLVHAIWWLTGAIGLVLGWVNLGQHTERRKLAEERTRNALKEKEALLQEIHHRVKNNLQVISSLLQLQINGIQEPQTRAVFQESQLRIRSMALIHEKLYQSDSLARINVAEYLRALMNLLCQTYARERAMVELRLDLSPAFVSVDTAIPLGLVANELISNSLKFAFPPGRRGIIRVEFRALPTEEYLLRISDDGTGMPDGLALETTESLGLRLVAMLTQQLRAEATWEKVPVGTSFSLRFRDTVFEARNPKVNI